MHFPKKNKKIIIVDITSHIPIMQENATKTIADDLNQDACNKSFAEIEAWIENSFTFEGYKTIRRKPSLTNSLNSTNAFVAAAATVTTKFPKNPTTIDNDGQLETAL